MAFYINKVKCILSKKNAAIPAEIALFCQKRVIYKVSQRQSEKNFPLYCSSNGKEMKMSKSEHHLLQPNSKEGTPGLSLSASLSSSPDLRNLHKIIHSAPRNKALWTLTHNTGFSDNDSNCSPIHRDSSVLHNGMNPRLTLILATKSRQTSSFWG